MIPAALQHRLLALANQVGAAADSIGAPATVHLETTDERIVRRDARATPALCLVLEGKRTVERAGRREIFRAGQLHLLPAGFRIEVVDEPCGESACFRAMHLEFGPALLARFVEDWPDAQERMPGQSALRLAEDPALAESLASVIESLLDPERHGRLLTQRLLLDVLLRLRRQGRLPDLLGTEGWDLETHVRELVRLNPAESWTAEGLAAAVGVETAVLLAGLEGAGGLQAVIDDERMGRASRLLRGGGVSLADVAYACGYASPEAFAQRMRAHADEVVGAR